MRRRVVRFFQTAKGLLTMILVGLIAIAAPGQGLPLVAVCIAAAVAAAGIVDAVILRLRKKCWEYPGRAVLTAFIVAMVLRAQEQWYVVAVTSVIAVLSKYAFRAGEANVFNPAALGMVVGYYLFHAGESWWGAQTDVDGPAKLILLAAGIYVTDRVNKTPLVLTFMATYFCLFTAAAFLGDPLSVAENFHTPDLEMLLYFAFFILTDPPTSPPKYHCQVICGPIVAALSFGGFKFTGFVYFPLAGVVTGKLCEAVRCSKQRRGYAVLSGGREPVRSA